MIADACRIVFAIVCLTAALAILDSPKVFACSCVEPRPPSLEFDQSTAVFAGTAVSIERDNYGMKVHFDAERAWKGVADSAVVVITADPGGACGYDFKQGVEYLVYASDNPPKASLCSRTQPVADAYVDLAALGPGYAPLQGQPAKVAENGTMMFLGIGLIVSAAGAAVALAISMRKKKDGG